MQQKREERRGGGMKGPRWTEEELAKFISGVKLYGKKWKQVAEHIGTRDRNMVGSYAFTFRKKLEKDTLHAGIDILPILQTCQRKPNEN